MSDPYLRALSVDRTETLHYYQKFVLEKSEQQKALEALLAEKRLDPELVADIACGGGSMAVHLAERWKTAHFTLVDANVEAVELAETNTRHLLARCLVGDIYDLKLQENAYDCVICWQTLSWLERPADALRELVRICKPGGYLFASSLFNLEHDVDIYARVTDRNRQSAAEGISYRYNTYAAQSVREWLADSVAAIRFHPFSMTRDLEERPRGLGTYTVPTSSGEKLQISGGMLMNWAILEIAK